MKIAVIGSGISGLATAYSLSKKYKVDLYEKNDHFGGHSYTYEIKEGEKVVPVDLGFIVFNKVTYPNLVKFFDDQLQSSWHNVLYSIDIPILRCLLALYLQL